MLNVLNLSRYEGCELVGSSLRGYTCGFSCSCGLCRRLMYVRL